MAVQQRRNSKLASKRRTHYKLAFRLVKCPACGEYKVPHKMCECGEYNGRTIVEK